MKERLLILLIVILVGWLYLPTLDYDYTYLDDQFIQIRAEYYGNMRHWPQAFGEDFFNQPDTPGRFYRPILTLSYMMDASLYGQDLWGYRVTNLFLFGVAVSLVYFLLHRLTRMKRWSLILTGLMAIHPLSIQAVAWIPGRNDTLLMIWILFSFWFLMDDSLRRQRLTLVAHGFFLALALLTKESALAWVALLPLTWRLISSQPLLLKRYLPLWTVLSGGFLGLRSVVLGGQQLDWAYMLGEAGKNVSGYAMYLAKLVWPRPLSVLPVLPDFPFLWLGFLVLGILFILLVYLPRRHRFFAGYSLLWVGMFLGLTLLPVDRESQYHFFLEHRWFIPFFGLNLFLLTLLKAWPTYQRKLEYLAVALMVGLAGISTRHVVAFAKFEPFWQNAIATSPSAAVGYVNLGTLYYQRGQHGPAEKLLLKALELYPSTAYAAGNLGALYLDQGDVDRAIVYLDQELSYRRYDDALFNRGVVAQLQEAYEEAEGYWIEAYSRNPHHMATLMGLTQLYYLLDLPEKGEVYYQQAHTTGAVFDEAVEEYYRP
jgi:protein O-mannosyl-transferase